MKTNWPGNGSGAPGATQRQRDNAAVGVVGNRRDACPVRPEAGDIIHAEVDDWRDERKDQLWVVQNAEDEQR